MRIAFVVPRFGEDVVGGAEMLARAYAERLSARGFSVEVLTTCARDHLTWANVFPPGEELHDGVRVRRYPLEPVNKEAYDHLNGKIIRRLLTSVEEQTIWARMTVPSPALLDAIAERREASDLMIFLPYLFGTTLLGVPLAREKAVMIPCLHDEPFAHLELTRQAFEGCRGLIFNAPAERTLARGIYFVHDIPDAVVGFGFDPSARGDGERFRAAHGITGDIVLYMGRKEYGKKVHLLVEYFLAYRDRSNRDVTLVLLGQGPVTPPPGAGRAVLDLGFVSSQEKMDACAPAAVLCQPSPYESFGIVFMEAWLGGAACLVNGASPVTVSHCAESGGGLWFSDYYDFAEALEWMLAHPEERARMAAAGRAYTGRRYGWPSVMDRLAEGLRRIASSRSPETPFSKPEKSR